MRDEDLTRRWNDDARNLGQFRADHGRWPHTHGAHRDEAHLGRFLLAQRAVRRIGKLTPDKEAALDSAAPGWSLKSLAHNTDLDQHQIGLRSIAELGLFRIHRGRKPVVTSTNAEEQRLARLLAKARTDARHGRLRPARRAALDEHAPWWDDDL